MNFTYLIENGGSLLPILLALSVINVSALIERALFWGRGGGRVKGPEPLAFLLRWKKRGPSPDEVARLRATAGGRLLLLTHQERLSSDKSNLFDETVRAEMQMLTGKLSLFDALVQIAPLVGILGTVVGLVQGFAESGAGSGALDHELLTRGVAQALITTIFGISIAVMALAGRFYLESKVLPAVESLERYTAQLNVIREEEPAHGDV